MPLFRLEKKAETETDDTSMKKSQKLVCKYYEIRV